MAGTLTGKTPKNTYKELLKINTNFDPLDEDAEIIVMDGDGTEAPIAMSQTRVVVRNILKFLAKVLSVSPTNGDLEYDGNEVYFTTNSVRGILRRSAVRTFGNADPDITLDYSDHIFTGTTASKSMPAVKKDVVLYLSNNGSGNLTLTSDGGSNTLWKEGSASNSVLILPLEIYRVVGDGNFWRFNA